MTDFTSPFCHCLFPLSDCNAGVKVLNIVVPTSLFSPKTSLFLLYEVKINNVLNNLIAVQVLTFLYQGGRGQRFFFHKFGCIESTLLQTIEVLI